MISKEQFFSKEQFYFLQQLHQLNYSNIDTFININKQNQKSSIHHFNTHLKEGKGRERKGIGCWVDYDTFKK